MAGKIPRWESDLWLYISRSDGMHCPLDNQCQIRQSGGWCPCDHLERINHLLDTKRLSPKSYGFVQRGACCWIFRMVEKLADRYLELGGVRYPPVPTELISLFDKRNNIEVHELPLKTCHGAIWNIENRWIIQLQADDTSAMKRFILFHEAFHVLAHNRTNPVFKRRGILQGYFNELLADYFATAILLPVEWLKKRWEVVHDLNRMVRIFDVPKPLICIRLKRMGLI